MRACPSEARPPHLAHRLRAPFGALGHLAYNSSLELEQLRRSKSQGLIAERDKARAEEKIRRKMTLDDDSCDESSGSESGDDEDIYSDGEWEEAEAMVDFQEVFNEVSVTCAKMPVH